MSPEEIVRKYLPLVNIMQLATSINQKPYICTVHYYNDEDLNLYWCSLLSRRHSEEITSNPEVAAYVLVHENTPEEDYVTGITIIGRAELLGSDIDPKALAGYTDKHNEDDGFAKDIINDKSPHKFYRLKPYKIVLFDNKNFPDNPRQEWELI